MKTKNGHILTFSDKMQICTVSCFTTCDWFCPMTSHMMHLIAGTTGLVMCLVATAELETTKPQTGGGGFGQEVGFSS